MKPDINSRALHVLVTGAGGPAAIAFFKAARHVENVEVHMADMDPYATGLYLVGPDRRCLLPPGNDAHFASEVLHYCKSANIDVIVPTVDCELVPLARERTRFDAAGIRMILSREKTLATCADKFRLMEQLRSLISLPKYDLYDDTFCPVRFGYPFVIKPRTGSGSRGVRVITAASELAGVKPDGSYMVQEYLPGAEYSVDVYVAEQSRVVASVIRERIKVDSGVAVVSKTLIDDEIGAMARTIARLVGIRYVANIQFRLNANGQPRLLEINPRFPGTMSLTVAAGVNMPQMCLRETRGETLDRSLSYESIAMVRSWHETFLPAHQFLESPV